jgi:hypothetical protein
LLSPESIDSLSNFDDGNKTKTIAKRDHKIRQIPSNILLRLIGPTNDDRALFASITHLRFNQAGPVAREITAYQRHRAKRLQG